MQADQAGFVQLLNKRCDNWSYDNFPHRDFDALTKRKKKTPTVDMHPVSR